MDDAAAVRHNRDANRFELEREGRVAIAEYRLRGDTITFTHTYVPPELRGGGIATALVRGALDCVRAQGLKVVPACSFVAKYMREHPETQDLLAAQHSFDF